MIDKESQAWLTVIGILVLGLLGGGFLVYADHETQHTNTVAATNDFRQAFEISGYKTAGIGKTTFAVNFTGEDSQAGEMFIDADNITDGRFIVSDQFGGSNEINIADGFANNKKTGYLLGIKRIKEDLSKTHDNAHRTVSFFYKKSGNNSGSYRFSGN